MKRLVGAFAIGSLVLVGCGGGSGDDASPESTAAVETTAAESTTEAPPTSVDSQESAEAEVTAGPVTVLTNEYGLPDTTGWSTAAVFDLTNNGEFVVAVPVRVQVQSDDGQTTATSDGTDAFVLGPGETITVVLDDLDPTGPNPPTSGEVTVYDRAGVEAAALIGGPDWVSSNEAFDCDNGLVGCGFTGDLTFEGGGLGSPGRIQVVVYRGDEIVAAGYPTTEVLDVNSGGTVPYAGQITSLESWDGSGATAVEVAVEQLTYGD